MHRRITSDKVLSNKAFNISKYPKYDAYEIGSASMVYKCLEIRPSSSGDQGEVIPNLHSAK